MSDTKAFAAAVQAMEESFVDTTPRELIDQMTPREWAQVRHMVAAGNMEVADRICAGIAMAIMLVGSAVFPGAFWAALIIGYLFWWLVPRPFTKAYEVARDAALRAELNG